MQFEVRDAEGSGRYLASTVRAGADYCQIADIIFTAVTERSYIDADYILEFQVLRQVALSVGTYSQTSRYFQRGNENLSQPILKCASSTLARAT
ncbi:hypothetical protein NUACC21_80800 [Scytonema sp. NUACC21]